MNELVARILETDTAEMDKCLRKCIDAYHTRNSKESPGREVRVIIFLPALTKRQLASAQAGKFGTTNSGSLGPGLQESAA